MREGAQLRGGFVRIAADGEKFLDQGAQLPGQRRLGAERCLLEETVGDLANRSATHRCDPRNGQQIGNQRMRALRIGTGKRREHSLIFRRCLRHLD